MKNILITIATLAIIAGTGCLNASAGIRFGGKKIKGSGNLVTRTLPAPRFEAIDASRGVNVIVTDQASEITVKADDNLIDLVVVEAAKGTLTVTMDKELNSFTNANITVTVPANGQINSLDASSASKIIVQTPLKADKFSMDTSSAATIEATVEAVSCSMDASSASRIEATVTATSCSLDASSASKIEATVKANRCSVEQSSASGIVLSGSSQSLMADLSSASSLNAAKFTAENANIETSSGASVTLDCSAKLNASATSGSSIRYTGDCHASVNTSSGGSVKKN